MYTPTPAPATPDALPSYLREELQALAQSLVAQQPFLYLQKLNTAPTKPREGMIAKADGTNWNPGSGIGVYVYQSGAWVFFGSGSGSSTGGLTLGQLVAYLTLPLAP